MILYDESRRLFRLDAGASSYAFYVGDGGYIHHLYYGARLTDSNLTYLDHTIQTSSFSPLQPGVEDGYQSLDVIMQECSVNGTGDFRASALQIRDANGHAATDLRYRSHRIIEGKYAIPGLPACYANTPDEASTLELILIDALTGAEVTLRYGVYERFSAITRQISVVNHGSRAFDIERIFSACVDFPRCDFDLISLWGHWSSERRIARRPIAPGEQGISSKRGSSGHSQNPFIALCDPHATETVGEVYGFSFVYSGSFEASVEVDSYGMTRAIMGLESTDFNWHLEPDERFDAPEVVMVYSAEGLGGMSRVYHRLYRHNLCRGDWKLRRRPIIVNNWEATYFNFDADKLVSIARDAAELGIEMLVMDDGWFGARNNDLSSLGDWFVNEEKLPGGLSELVRRINALGVKFGIWFEPEMISPVSRLHDAHPDWVLSVPGRPKSLARHQYILDMSRKDVQDYLFDTLSAVLNSANIEYVKWDFNRNLTEAGSLLLDAVHQKEIFHRYVLGLYSLLERLHDAFPHLLLEGCSGGGGRYDPGMLYYTPQIWTSDDSDAMERLFIQFGTSMVYPPSSMSAHVSAVPNHQTGRVTPFATRGNVAMAGAFGYELDLNKLTDDERALVRKQVQDYHKYYDIIQNGSYYRLISPFDDRNLAAWASVSEDRREVIVTVAAYRYRYPRALRLRIPGLDPAAVYADEDGNTYRGDTLMNAGLNMTRRFTDGDSLTVYLKALD